MTEAEVEMLEMYLDDALSDHELAAVARRIAQEPVMAAELERLRGERELRRQLFVSMEPSEAAVERLLGRVDESIRRRIWWERQVKWGRWASAAAACVVIGFTTGYLGRGGSQQVNDHVAFTPGNGIQVQPVAENANPQQPGITWVGRVPAQVQLTDDNGQVIGTQRFESVDKANEFVNDLQTWQDRQRQVQNGNIVFTGGKF